MPQTLISFQKENNIQISYTSVWLEESDNIEIYYCPKCRCPVFQHKGNVVQELPGDSDANPPIIIQCRNKNCGKKYMIHPFVKNG